MGGFNVEPDAIVFDINPHYFFCKGDIYLNLLGSRMFENIIKSLLDDSKQRDFNGRGKACFFSKYFQPSCAFRERNKEGKTATT
jgi:hypothetical protein